MQRIHIRRLVFVAVLSLLILACSVDPLKLISGGNETEKIPASPTLAPFHTQAPTLPPSFGGRVENESFAFEYDAGWQPFFDGELPNFLDIRLDVETLGAVVEVDSAIETPLNLFFPYAVVVMRKAIPPGSSLQQVYQETYAAQYLDYPDQIRESSSELGGRPALERIYPYFAGEPRHDIRELWVEVDGWAYILSQRAKYTAQVNLYRPGFKTIENSFSFQ